MYRLLNLKAPLQSRIPSTTLFNFKTKTKKKSIFETIERHPCNACARNQSTITNPSQYVKKTKKRTKNKYYDVLVGKDFLENLNDELAYNTEQNKLFIIPIVTDKCAKQQKTSVKKLTWGDLKLLASTNLDLNELHMLRIKNNTKSTTVHTYNNLALIETPTLQKRYRDDIEEDAKDGNEITCNIPSKQEYPKLNEEQTIEDEFIDDTNELDLSKASTNAFQPEIVEESLNVEVEETETSLHNCGIPDVENSINVRKEGKVPQFTPDKEARLEIATKTLSAYIEVCANLKMPHKGLNALQFHKSRASRSKDKHFMSIKNIKVFNALLKGFAAKGDFQKVEDLLNVMRVEGVALDLQSYVAILECLGRVQSVDYYSRQISVFCKEAIAKGFTFDRIMNEGTFLGEQRKLVLECMRKFDVNYTPVYWTPDVHYDNCLLNHFNEDEQLKAPSVGGGESKEADGILFSVDKLKESVEKQVKLEIQGYVDIKSIESRGEVTEEVTAYRRVLDEHFKNWHETALKAFNRDLCTLSAQRTPLNFEPYLRSVPVKDIVAIIVDEAKKIADGSETYSPTVSYLYRDLGIKLYARYKIQRKQKTGVLNKIISIHNQYCSEYATMSTNKNVYNARQRWQWSEHNLRENGATLTMDHCEWSPSTLQTIGKFLYRIIMHDLKIDVNAMRLNSKHKNHLPAFYTIFRSQGRIVKEEIKPHPVLCKLYRASMPETLTFPAYSLPMHCPPVPWTSINNGGYLISPCDVVRLPSQAMLQKKRMSDATPSHLYPSLDALNQLGGVPWKVNTRILDIVLDVFNKGGSAQLNVPEPPTSLPAPQILSTQNCNGGTLERAEKYKLFKQRLQHKRKQGEMYSLWCDCLYRLSLANHYRDTIFWLPHNMDFRGRVYPIPPHLHHLGADLARSMLVFAESRPLGPHGLDWLKLHLVNLCGTHKHATIFERLRYANTLEDVILESADRPLEGDRWWANADEPWQVLACCMEIANAMRCPDGVEAYRTHFPVHQDGSCNGLQHYAALGRDATGGRSVNLCAASEPQDVYSAVAVLVEKQRKYDAENGWEIAKKLKGFVKRKVIKQTVMTTVYGVTRFGARLQIARQLKDIDEFPKEFVWEASFYLTTRTFESIRSMFTSTKEIQDWFTDCAKLISKVNGQQVEWITPMGLPIVQPYSMLKSLSGSLVYKPYHIDQYEKPNVMKQKNAFPPNFIHSLDSSHMMLTSLHCERAGITFVSVHDCYWTHPSTVNTMNKICREQFVSLHSQPILENLSLFLADKYSYDLNELKGDGSVVELTKKKLNRTLRQLPKTGDLNIHEVLESVYFFS